MNASSGKALLGWLLVLLVGIGASTWQLVELPGSHGVHHGGHGHAATDGPQPLFSWQPHEVRRIELRAPGRSVDMVLTGSGWQGAPAGFDADAFVTMFSRARADRRFEPMHDDDYGLEPGLMTVLVKDAEERVLAGLTIGESLPDGIGRYVRGTTDSEITVIPDYQVRPLLQAAGMSTAMSQADSGQTAGVLSADTGQGSASMALNHVQ